MKKILLSLLFILVLAISYSQVIVVRGKGNVTQEDSNLFIGNSFRVPIFSDTASANANRQSLDSSGKVIYTRDLNWFWGRQTSPTRKWIPFNNVSNGLNATCGYPNGTHIITWDSLTTFDVTAGPYVLCCDGLPRSTAFTTITLDSNDADDPRIDLIILDSNGVNSRKGTPSANPATPQTDSCEIILSYVLIPAHDSVPANINSSSNPFVIYDENYDTEAVLDSSVGITYDTADLSNPSHLLNDISVTSFESDNLLRFTLPDSIDLNDYGAFKFYARKTGAGQIGLTFTWYSDDVQQTFPVTEYVEGSTSAYQIFVVPVSLFRILRSTNVDELYISVSGTTSQFFVDWIQLQTGILITNIFQSPTLTYVGSSNLNPVFNVTVTNPTTTPVLNFSQQNATASTVLGNASVDDGSYGWVKVNLGTMVDSLLDVFNLYGGSSGDILKNVNGVWTPQSDSSGITDTTFTQNWIGVAVGATVDDGDTLQFGARDIDSSLLAFDTYLGLDGYSLNITQSTDTVFHINPSGAIEFGNYGAGTFTGDETFFLTVDAYGHIIEKDSVLLEADNGLEKSSPNNVQLGGTLLHNTTNNTSSFIHTLSGATVYEYPYAFRHQQHFENGTGVAYFWNNGSGDAAQPDNTNLVRLGVNYSGAVYNAISDLNGYFKDKMGYSVGVNWTGHGSFGAYVDDPSSKTGGILIHTLDTAFTDMVTIYGKHPTTIDGDIAIASGGIGFDDFRLATFHDDGAFTLFKYGVGTFTGVATYTLQVDATGHVIEGNPSGSTLQQVFNTETGGSVLSKIDSIQAGAFGILVLATGSVPTRLQMNPASTNTAVPLLELSRTTSSTAATNIGGSIDLYTETDGGTARLSNQLVTTWTTVTDGSRASRFRVNGVFGASTVDVFTANGDGSWQMRTITATAASAITPTDGMILFVSSTNGTFTSIGFWAYEDETWNKL